MARNTVSSKNSRKAGKKAGASGEDRTIFFVLAGFTALIIVTIAAAAIISTVRSNNAAEKFTPNDQGLLKAGSKAPDFSTKTIDGKKVSLADKGGKKATMLVFFASWCPHCQKEAPVISDFQSQYKDLRIMMIGIDGQDNTGKVQDFVNKYGINSPATYDPPIGATYKVSGYPTVYVLDGNDKVVAANSGEAPREVFEGWIEKALN